MLCLNCWSEYLVFGWGTVGFWPVTVQVNADLAARKLLSKPDNCSGVGVEDIVCCYPWLSTWVPMLASCPVGTSTCRIGEICMAHTFRGDIPTALGELAVFQIKLATTTARCFARPQACNHGLQWCDLSHTQHICYSSCTACDSSSFSFVSALTQRCWLWIACCLIKTSALNL